MLKPPETACLPVGHVTVTLRAGQVPPRPLDLPRVTGSRLRAWSPGAPVSPLAPGAPGPPGTAAPVSPSARRGTGSAGSPLAPGGPDTGHPWHREHRQHRFTLGPGARQHRCHPWHREHRRHPGCPAGRRDRADPSGRCALRAGGADQALEAHRTHRARLTLRAERPRCPGCLRAPDACRPWRPCGPIRPSMPWTPCRP